MQSERAKNIFKAAQDADTNTISRLLPDATAEELHYEQKVCIFPCCSYFLCNVSSNHLFYYKMVFNLCALCKLFYCLTENSSKKSLSYPNCG